MTKTCGECKYYEVDEIAAKCEKHYIICDDDAPACEHFKARAITNGDKIRQNGATKLLSLYSTQWLIANIKDLLLEKLFFSLPIEEQNKIVHEVVRELGEKNCAAMVAKLKEVCDEEIR